MAGLKSLVCVAFLGALGITALILACALPGIWWPFFNIIFYILAPVPTLIAQRNGDGNGSGAVMDVAIFITMGFVISAFGLPIILHRAPTAIITATSCYLTIVANIVVFLTLLGFFVIFQEEESFGYLR